MIRFFNKKINLYIIFILLSTYLYSIPTDLVSISVVLLLFFLPSAAVWLHHHLRGGLPPGAPLRSAQQLGRGPPGRPQVCVWVPPAGGPACAEHRRLVQHPGGPVAPLRHRKREFSMRRTSPPGLLLRKLAKSVLTPFEMPELGSQVKMNPCVCWSVPAV